MVPLLETEVGTVRQVTKSQIKLLALTSSLSFLVSTAHLLVLRAIPPRERDEGTERKAEWHETRWAVKRRGREQNMSDRGEEDVSKWRGNRTEGGYDQQNQKYFMDLVAV